MMREEGLPEVVIRSFAHYYQQLVDGHTGLIPESAIHPVLDVPDSECFSPALASVGRSALAKTVMVKLNGGLGTGMGLNKAKSLLVVKEGLCFLDIIAKQALETDVPLVLMNSFNTSADSLSHMERYPGLSTGPIPLEFLQHKVPKVLVDDFGPALAPEAPARTWCPPGHGDIYTAMVTTGILDTMLDASYEYLFVSNADNLGAVMDVSLLGHFVQEKLPFMMEVADRTLADRKGGHLAQKSDGSLLLRESAQCPEEDLEQFQDVSRHQYFNTNNLWIHLPTLKKEMDARDQVLGLAMIRNKKTLDPRDPSSPSVYQLETAMGSAISVFEKAGAVRVPRSRFAPVKTTSDLLAVRSDAYELKGGHKIVPSRPSSTVIVDLDPAYFKQTDDLDLRFPHGPPSLVDCVSFRVRGDVRFGANLRCEGEVEVSNDSLIPLQIDSDTVLR
jgi:UTP--glucose-1-phosphate uridylyltransferase